MVQRGDKSGVAAPAQHGWAPLAMIYKVMGRAEYVIVRCDPHLVEDLKEIYAGIPATTGRGHQSRASGLGFQQA